MRRISGLRRRAVVAAAMAAVLGVVPGLTALHHHLWIAFVCIGLQVVLITLALSFLVRSRRGGEAPCSNDAGRAR